MTTDTPIIPQGLERTGVEKLCQAITEGHVADLVGDIKPQNTQPYLYLSGLHACARHLFYLMTQGDKRPPVDAYVQGLFRSGNIWEAEIKRDLLKMRLEMVKAQEEVKITYSGSRKDQRGVLIGKGKIDGVIRFEGQDYPAEIKSMDGNMFKRLNTVDDLLDYEHTEKYLRQLLMYLYAKEKEQGLFILGDCRSHIKPIPIFLGNHLDIAERALRNMERAWEAKIDGVEPDRITYHSKTCGRCAFAPICLPEIIVGGADAIDDADLEAKLARHEELKPIAAEFDEIHDDVKEMFKGKPRTTISQHFEVVVATQSRTRLNKALLDAEAVKAATEKYEIQVVKVNDLLKHRGNKI